MTSAQNSAAEFELGEEQIRKLMASARSFRNRVVLELLYYGGLRRAEACALDVSDLDFPNRLLVVRNGKGSRLSIACRSRNREPRSDAPRFHNRSHLVEVAGLNGELPESPSKSQARTVS